MFRKFMLTSVVIFVKPGTTAQLAAAFMITLGFLILHVTTNAYQEPDENMSQLCGSLSILLTLFSGILIRGQAGEDDDPYETALITFVIVGSQASVILIFIYCLASAGSGESAEERLKENLAGGSLEERLKEKLAGAAEKTSGESDEHMEELLSSVEAKVKQLSESDVVPPSVCETLLAIVDSIRNNELGEFSGEVTHHGVKNIRDVGFCAGGYGVACRGDSGYHRETG